MLSLLRCILDLPRVRLGTDPCLLRFESLDELFAFTKLADLLLAESPRIKEEDLISPTYTVILNVSCIVTFDFNAVGGLAVSLRSIIETL